MQLPHKPLSIELRSTRDLYYLLRSISPKICTMATIDRGSYPESALMGFAVAPDASLIFNTHKSTRKWESLSANPRVALTMVSPPHGPYFQIEGVAMLADAGPGHNANEDAYFSEHPNAIRFKGKFYTASIKVRPQWLRFFPKPLESDTFFEYLLSGNTLQAPGISIRQTFDDEFQRVQEFYYNHTSYRHALSANDVLIIAERSGKIVGALRLCKEFDCIVLRGINVAESNRQQGIATAMLFKAKRIVGSHELYCIAYSHLQKLYEPVGFTCISEGEAPEFLRQRLAQYALTEKYVLTLMRAKGMTSLVALA